MAAVPHWSEVLAARRRLDDFPWGPPLDERGGFADWIRVLRGRSGVYLIREAGGGALLYVGESHTDGLYSTLTRHLQRWEGVGSGWSYKGRDVLVSVIITDPEDAEPCQFALIQTFDPLDNQVRGDGGRDRPDVVTVDDLAEDLAEDLPEDVPF